MYNDNIGSACKAPKPNGRYEQMMHVLLCDDDAVFGEKLKNAVISVLDSLEIRYKINAVKSGGEISDYLYSTCDILFLDIDLMSPKYNGMDIARKARTFRSDSVIVFVTNYIEYAPEGYEVQAFRYILKRDILAGNISFIYEAAERFKRFGQTFKINIEGEIIDLPVENIMYLTVQQHSILAVMKKTSSRRESKTYCFRGSLSKLENELESQGFLRTHKSYLVNMRYIKRLQCRELSLSDGTALPVGEKSYSEQKKKYLLWKGLK